MRVKVQTVLKTNDEKKEFSGFGIYSNNKLQYVENGVKVTLHLKNQEMIREDLEKKLVYKFQEKEETVNELFLIQHSLSCPITIYTNAFFIENSECHIIYELVLEDILVDYQICWEEVK